MAADGLSTLRSSFGPKDTMNRLKAEVKSKGMTVFARIVTHAGMVEELEGYETAAFGGPPGRWEQVAEFRPDVAATSLIAPTQTFERSMVLEGGGMRVELRHVGLGHTRGDAVVWLPQARVIFAGGLVAHGPFNLGGAS